MRNNITPKFIVVDLFCGAGGTTTGFANTNGLAKVIACVNHDANAIKSHWLNHPDVKHFNEDIRTFDLKELVSLVNHYRKLYPKAKLILWASLECTNFSKAKGGQPRDADSRTLADHLLRYITALYPEIIQIENVVEFMAWGPLDENGKPVSRQNGKEWMRWRKEICRLGYFDEWKQLNAADFGAYTSRNRLFGMFALTQNLIAWPEPTHCKNPSSGNMFNAPKKWMPVREVLDFDDEGNSIFNRKKDLSPKTYDRIYAGLIKYIAGGDTSFIQKYFSGRPAGKVISVNGPAGTIKTVDGQCIIQPKFLMNYHHSSDVNSTECPSPIITCKDKLAVVNTCFLSKYNGKGSNIPSMEDPSPTISTKDRLAKIQPIWLDKQYTGKDNHQSVENPAGSILANDKHSLINTVWIDRPFKSGGYCQSVDQPAGSILSVPKLNQVTAKKFVMDTNYNNVGSSIENPCPVITASRRHHYIINPSWTGNTGSVDSPCCTVIARQDKSPLYLVTTEKGCFSIPIYDTDCEALINIKKFMAIYGIIDIKMRMLKIIELLLIQGFEADTKLFGTQTDQKKFIGNAVHPLIPENWIYAINNNIF